VPSHPSSIRFLRLVLVITAIAAAVGAVTTPDVHGRPLVLLAPQAADADYLHQIDTISATMFAIAVTGARPSATTHDLLAAQAATLDQLQATGRVPAEFVTSHVALRTAVELLDHSDETPDAEYVEAAAEFARDYQAALRAVGLPPARGA
jgi:hypothetical protein